jgi:hypothetical protein
MVTQPPYSFHIFKSFPLVTIINDKTTVVKELRSKIFRQHPGCYKAVFLKKTQRIIVSVYEYTVYIML